MYSSEIIKKKFATVLDLLEANAREYPNKIAIHEDQESITYQDLCDKVKNFAIKTQQMGVNPHDTIAICASTSIYYVIAFLGGLKSGAAIAPLAPSSSAESLLAMLNNCKAKIIFHDDSTKELMQDINDDMKASKINFDTTEFNNFIGKTKVEFNEVEIGPDWAFNLIYSSGTTGAPKGIVQPHSMRWAHVQRGIDSEYSNQSVILISTPLYSNTTLVSFFPGISLGGTVVLMKKFNALNFLKLAEKFKVTHAMLVPVQYQRIMTLNEFEKFDLSSFKQKFCTSAPFSSELKSDVLKRWPGGLTEYYGMTEGGGTVILKAHEFPNKLNTVGKPAATSDIRLINDDGIEVPQGKIGEVVGSSPAMMKEYYREPAKTKEAEWFSPDNKRFIRTGDIGYFDNDGFLVLMDRKKDMIISGGFNIYPSDLELVLSVHPQVQEASVVGVPSKEWGETPVAFVVLKNKSNVKTDTASILEWANQKLGKFQRISELFIVEELPRSHIGKVLKRELRNNWEKTT